MLASPRSPIRAFTECTVIKFQYDLDTGLSYFIIFQKRKGIDRLEVQLFISLIFLFHQSKNNAVFELRIRTFQELVGFDAKVKDYKNCPCGRLRCHGGHGRLYL